MGTVITSIVITTLVLPVVAAMFVRHYTFGLWLEKAQSPGSWKSLPHVGVVAFNERMARRIAAGQVFAKRQEVSIFRPHIDDRVCLEFLSKRSFLREAFAVRKTGDMYAQNYFRDTAGGQEKLALGAVYILK